MSSSDEEEFVVHDDEEDGEEEYQDDDDDDDDEPLSSLKISSAAPASTPVGDDSDDSDDDIPLAALKSPDTKRKEAALQKKKKQTGAKKAVAKISVTKKTTVTKASKPKVKKAVKKKKQPVTSTPTKSNSSGYRSMSAVLFVEGCRKGELIQRILCRWWYAIEWPALESTIPPPHYDSLDGMPGVFIATSGNHVGHILDKRDKTKCPSFQNLVKKSCSELQKLLLTALEGQRKALLEAGGPGTSHEREIDKLVKWTEKVKPEAADKEATRLLKAAKMSLE